MKKKFIKPDTFINHMLDPANVNDFSKELKNIGLNVN